MAAQTGTCMRCGRSFDDCWSAASCDAYMHTKKDNVPRVSFEDWMKQVDDEVYRRTGMAAEDLPDVCYRDWYEDGVTVKSATSRAIRNAKES